MIVFTYPKFFWSNGLNLDELITLVSGALPIPEPLLRTIQFEIDFQRNMNDTRIQMVRRKYEQEL